MIENIPIDTNTLFCSPPKIRFSPNTLHTDSGTLARSKSSSPQQQQSLSFTSTIFAPKAIGSTTSLIVYIMSHKKIQFCLYCLLYFLCLLLLTGTKNYHILRIMLQNELENTE